MRETMTPQERRAKAQWLWDHLHPDDKEELERVWQKKQLAEMIAKAQAKRERKQRLREELYEWDMVAPWVDKMRGTSDHPDIAGW